MNPIYLYPNQDFKNSKGNSKIKQLEFQKFYIRIHVILTMK